MLAFNILWDGFHRSGTIKGYHGVNVMNGCWFQLLEKRGHAGTVELEETHGFTFG